MILSATRRHLIAALFGALALASPARGVAGDVLVFAASSLKTALDQIATDYQAATGQKVTVSYAATSVLARQIELGAPADLFISASADWMDVLQDKKAIQTLSRVDLLGNRLVLIGGANSTRIGQIGHNYDLVAELGEGFLAMALVDAVPAGVYGKAALQDLGLWDSVKDRVAQADNARAALALVAAGAAPLGVVYRSDAQAEHRVQLVATIPEEAHPPIVYPAALTTSAAEEARGFLEYLQSDAATQVFLGQGFTLPDG